MSHVVWERVGMSQDKFEFVPDPLGLWKATWLHGEDFKAG